jgi:hypothetical protein
MKNVITESRKEFAFISQSPQSELVLDRRQNRNASTALAPKAEVCPVFLKKTGQVGTLQNSVPSSEAGERRSFFHE